MTKQTRPQSEQNPANFIDLYGDRVGVDFLNKTVCTPEFVATGVFLIIPMLQNASKGEKLWLSALAIAIIVSATKKGFDYVFLKKGLKREFGNNHKTLVINKTPDNDILPTKPEHIAAAQRLSERHSNGGGDLLFAYFATIGLPSSFIIPMLYENMPLDQATIATGLLLANPIPLATFRAFLTAHRFNKVAKGEWVIEDCPPPEFVPAKKKRNSLFGKWSTGGLAPNPVRVMHSDNAKPFAPADAHRQPLLA